MAGGMCGGGYAWQGGLRALETATAASGTHYYYWNALFFSISCSFGKKWPNNLWRWHPLENSWILDGRQLEF